MEGMAVTFLVIAVFFDVSISPSLHCLLFHCDAVLRCATCLPPAVLAGLGVPSFVNISLLRPLQL